VQAIGTNFYVAYAKQDADKKDDEAKARALASWMSSTRQDSAWFASSLALGSTRPGNFLWLPANSANVATRWTCLAAANCRIQSCRRSLRRTREETCRFNSNHRGSGPPGFGADNANSGPYKTLFFTAGPNDEGDGTFGTLVPVATKLSEVDEP
jgi:hypothetical protein